MTRSKWKFKFVEPSLFYQFHKYKETFQNKTNKSELESLEVWSRASVIKPEFVNSVVEVYNGMNFVPIQLDFKLVNHKFGEFSFSKRSGPTIHVFGKKKKKK